MTTAVLIPAMRSDKLVDLVVNIHATTPDCSVLIAATRSVVRDLIAVVPPGGRQRENVEIYCDEGGTWGERLNFLAGEAFTDESVTHIFLGADDIKFHDHWHDEATRAMAILDGVVMVNDLCSERGTLPLVSRRYLEEEGATADHSGLVIHPGYWHNFSERELVELATARGRYAYCPTSVVEHLHWMAGKADRSDPVYQLGEQHWDEDLALYQSREHFWKGESLR